MVEAVLSSAEQFDKYILTLASGALALSLTFIKNIAPFPVPYSTIILSVSWLCLIVSILSTLISFLTSQKACSNQIQILENSYLRECQPEKNCMSLATMWLNRTSILFFILGISFLSIFSIVNLNNPTRGDKMTRSTEQPIKKGYVPPTTPAQPQMEKRGYVPPPPPPPPKKPQNDSNSGD